MAHSNETVRIVQATDACLDVDIQTTFMPAHDGHPEGGLAVKEGHLILPIVRKTDDLFKRKFATVDRHPLGHISLASSYVDHKPFVPLHEYPLLGMEWWPIIIGAAARFSPEQFLDYLTKVKVQMLWPDHAIEGTPEGELHPTIDRGAYLHVQVKGTDPACDSYSGFFDNLKRPTGLDETVRKHGVKRLFLRGLAFDYCVGWTALDAVALGYEVFIIEDATRSVDMADSVEKMRKDLDAAGVKVIRSDQLRSF
jgi:nicotinamidase/pyrazinamidase